MEDLERIWAEYRDGEKGVAGSLQKGRQREGLGTRGWGIQEKLWQRGKTGSMKEDSGSVEKRRQVAEHLTGVVRVKGENGHTGGEVQVKSITQRMVLAKGAEGLEHRSASVE